MLRLAIGLGSQIKVNRRKQLSALWTGRAVEKSWNTKKKMASSDFCKYKCPVSTKIFTNENLTFKNETLAFHGRKLKGERHIFSSYNGNGVVFIKKSERSKPIKIPILKTFYDQFPGVFSKNEENDAERSPHQDVNFNWF